MGNEKELNQRILTNENGQVYLYDRVDVRGTLMPEINYRELFKSLGIDKKIPRGTIDGSCIENELYILSLLQKKGFYFASDYRAILCDIEKINKIENNGFWEVKIEYTEWKCSNLVVLDIQGFKSALWEWISDDEFDKKLDELIGNDKEKTYFELEGNCNKVYFYVEFGNEAIGLTLEKESKNVDYVWTNKKFESKLEVGKYTIKSEYGLEEGLRDFEREKLVEGIGLGIKKLENGFVYGNRFYKDLDDVLVAVEKEKEDKKDRG